MVPVLLTWLAMVPVLLKLPMLLVFCSEARVPVLLTAIKVPVLFRVPMLLVLLKFVMVPELVALPTFPLFSRVLRLEVLLKALRRALLALVNPPFSFPVLAKVLIVPELVTLFMMVPSFLKLPILEVLLKVVMVPLAALLKLVMV